MPFAAGGETAIYYEETGRGHPVLFAHEFAGDHRSWEAQVRRLSRRFRCVTFAARGYPPSDIPADPAAYSYELAVDDALAVLAHLGIDGAHVVGLSMGAYTALQLAIRRPGAVRSLVLAGCGSGSILASRHEWIAQSEANAAALERGGMAAFAAVYGSGRTRVQLKAKDERGYAEFLRMLSEHSAVGSANTMRGIQRVRPPLYDFEEQLHALKIPVLVIVGDEDEPCIEPSLFLKRTIPTAGLVVFPKSGHAVNLEEPARFDAELAEFLA